MTNEQLQIIISAQIEDLQKKLDAANKEVSGFEGKSKKSFDGFSKAVKAAGKATGAAMKAVGAAVAAGAAALVGLAESTKEYRTEQAKLITAFEAAGSSAEQAKTTYNDLYRVLGDSGQATEAASHLALLADNEKELAQWTEACQGIYATFGASLPIESLTEAANETAKVGTVTGALADALNWAGISEDAFNAKLEACNSEAEREALIRETLNSTYKNAAAAYEENAAGLLSANEAQAKLTDGLAQLGASAEPIVTVFKQGLADALGSITPHFSTISEGLMDMINGVEGGADKVSAGISDMVKTIADIILKFVPKLIPIGVDIILSLVKGIIKAIPELIDGVLEGINAIIEALPELMQVIVDTLPILLPALIEGIIALVVSLCNNLMAIIMPLIQALPNILISVINALMLNLPLLIEGLITLLMELVKALPQIIECIVEAIPDIISMLLDGIFNALPQIIEGLVAVTFELVKQLPQILATLIEAAVKTLAKIWESLTGIFGKLGSWFSDTVIEPIVNFFSGMWDKVKSGAKGAWEGIKNVFSSVANFFKNIFSNAWEAVKNVFSTGGKIFDGIKEGIVTAFKTVVNAIITGINKVIALPFKGLNGILDTIHGLSIAGIKPFSWLTWRAPVPEIPLLAKGGIVDSATMAVIGEQGKEAVVPLENNLEWLNKLSGMLADRLGGNNKPIVLMVDKKVLAEASAEGMNDITRLTGSFPLVFA